MSARKRSATRFDQSGLARQLLRPIVRCVAIYSTALASIVMEIAGFFNSPNGVPADCRGLSQNSAFGPTKQKGLFQNTGYRR